MQLPPFRLERFFTQYEFTSPYPICLSDCESVTIGDLLALESAADAGLRDLGSATPNRPAAPDCAAVAALYTTIAAEHVLMHSGAEEAIFNFRTLVQPGDHVIVHWPGYESWPKSRAASAPT
ncbi:MAG: hypothetical protein R3A10_08350 [Caldilineaceae bacterium]